MIEDIRNEISVIEGDEVERLDPTKYAPFEEVDAEMSLNRYSMT